MRALLQRVSSGKVSLPAGRQGINTKVVGEIGKGYVILLGVKEGDLLAEKVVNLRVMSDKENKMNLAIKDVEGEILVVSQFTLYADLSAGRRPSFVHAAKPEVAKKLYEYFIAKLKSLGIKNVQTGEFGAYMEVVIVNDGPVTIMMDSEEK